MVCKVTDLLSSKILIAGSYMLILLLSVAVAEEDSIESAQKLFFQGKYEESLAIISKVLEQNPNNAEAHALMGGALGMLAQKTPNMMMKMQWGMRAMQEFETALQLDPNNITARMGRGMSMLMAPPPFGNVDTALSDFQKILELDPNNAEGHFGLGLAYQKKGEIEKARGQFEETMRLNPDHEGAKAELGKLAGEKTELASSAEGRKEYGDGWFEEQNGFSILHLKGSPYDMGYQQGMLAKDVVGPMPDPAQVWDEQRVVYIRDRIERFDKFIPEEYREQMRGLADALGTSYDEILLWNTYGDVTHVSHSTPPARHCSSFLAFGEATADGKVVHGASLEFGDIVANRTATNNGKTVWLVVYEPDNGRRFALVLALPPQAMISGYFGINDAGLTISQTFLPARDSTLDGMPMFILLRKVIQYADGITAALKIIQEAPRTYGTSMMFADGKTNQGAAIEYSATQYAVRDPVDGTLVETNRVADEKLYEVMEKGLRSDAREEAMLLRAQRYAQMFEANYGQIDVPKAVNFLRDHLDLSTGRGTISFPGAIGSHMVVYSVVFRPADLDFWVARGAVPMVYGEFVGFNVRALLAGEKSQVTPARIPRDAYLDSEEFKMEIERLEEEARERQK